MVIRTSATKIRARVDLSGAVIPRTNLSRANLTCANLEKTNLSGADLSMAILVGAKLVGAILHSANMVHADLSEADLTGADLSGANLSSAKLVGANLTKVKLDNADLRGTNLRGVRNVDWDRLLSAYLDKETVFPEDLDETQFFDCVQRLTRNLKIDWQSEFPGGISDAIEGLNKQAARIGKYCSIRKFLMDADFYHQMAEAEASTKSNT